MESTWAIASLWMALALAASLFSIRLGVSVALVEILVGVLGGNFMGLHTTPWIDFLASFGAVLLTCLSLVSPSRPTSLSPKARQRRQSYARWRRR